MMRISSAGRESATKTIRILPADRLASTAFQNSSMSRPGRKSVTKSSPFLPAAAPASSTAVRSMETGQYLTPLAA